MKFHVHALPIIVCAFLMAGSVAAGEKADSRIDPAKIKDAIGFAETNKAFADKTAENLDVDASPRGLDGSDPIAVQEVIAMEREIERVYNTEFLTDPSAPLRYYVASTDRHYFDLLTPGEYSGDDVKRYFEFIGPAFIGRIEFKEMRVMAKGEVGFVVMKQVYYGKALDGTPVHWIMRQTDGVVKVSEKWKIMHTHISFPIKNFETREADILSSKGPAPWQEKPAAPKSGKAK